MWNGKYLVRAGKAVRPDSEMKCRIRLGSYSISKMKVPLNRTWTLNFPTAEFSSEIKGFPVCGRFFATRKKLKSFGWKVLEDWKCGRLWRKWRESLIIWRLLSLSWSFRFSWDFYEVLLEILFIFFKCWFKNIKYSCSCYDPNIIRDKK